MTGYYVRGVVDGKPVNCELEDLTDEELKAWALTLDVHAARGWAVALAGWIRDNVQARPSPCRPDSGGEVPKFQCPACGRVGYNPNDATRRYCGACHRFF